MDDTEHRDLLNVMALALIDGKLDEKERELIESLRDRAGVDDEEFRALVAQVREEPTKFRLGSEPDRYDRALRTLTEAAEVDGEVAEAERKVLRKLAERAGLAPDTIDRQLNSRLTAEQEIELNHKVEEIYAHFDEWDHATREAKLTEIAELGAAAVVPLLRIFESYRAPDGMADPLTLKVMVAEQLGRLEDPRAVYYLVQQVSIGETDDESSNPELRRAAAEALGRIVNAEFGSEDQSPVESVRQWWSHPDSKQYDRLAF